MRSVCRCLNTLQFPQAIASVGPKFSDSPKADNLLKTKRNFSDFCLPKAENILKLKQLANCKVGRRAAG